MGNSSKNRAFYAIKEVGVDAIKKNKFKFLFLAVIAMIAILTGVIIAIKTQSISTFTRLLGEKKECLNGTTFWLRLLSMLVVYTFIVLASLSPWLCPIAFLFVAYRAFLMGGNITLLIVFNGISGMVVGLLVVLPCQLISLALFVFLFLLLCEAKNYKKCYGCERVKNYWLLLVLIGVLLITIVCLVESLLISLLSPSVIFVF